MQAIKKMLPKRDRSEPTLQPKNNALLPRLIHNKKSKIKKHICHLLKPLRIGFLLESFNNPNLPLIILRPPTPMWEMYNVEERLFDRSGDNFVLKKSKARANFKQEGNRMLPVPVPKLEDLLMSGDEGEDEAVEAGTVYSISIDTSTFLQLYTPVSSPTPIDSPTPIKTPTPIEIPTPIETPTPPPILCNVFRPRILTVTPQRNIRMANGVPFDSKLCKSFCRSLGTCASYGVTRPFCELYALPVAGVVWTGDTNETVTNAVYTFYDLQCV
ncbi:hypothetical protein COCMIDRAFT_9622 [Bipolaris oryzae ATCC 44560]|uniref:Uncharacterized protein n=1 Tax=Bipolaris oryzae ATCC 44560 TaxID=930090 RepID=W6YMK4_COCMI|nr:uncharacterized protein COCMIDRAFT_9622 [Bipolaris oryzae ATCC 44560]EUC40507.1 hypothetical protein COCMIDRAFT_9622 [Bipolaris oryzae ATCC 44560]